MGRYGHGRWNGDLHGSQRGVVRIPERRAHRILDRLARVIADHDVASLVVPPIDVVLSEAQRTRKRLLVPGCCGVHPRVVHADFAAADPGDLRESAGDRVGHDVAIRVVHQPRLDLMRLEARVAFEDQRRRSRHHRRSTRGAAERLGTGAGAGHGRNRCAGCADFRLDGVVEVARTARRAADHAHGQRQAEVRVETQLRVRQPALDAVAVCLADHVAGNRLRQFAAKSTLERVARRDEANNGDHAAGLRDVPGLKAEITATAVHEDDQVGQRAGRE